jgi:hypothetical protein
LRFDTVKELRYGTVLNAARLQQTGLPGLLLPLP